MNKAGFVYILTNKTNTTLYVGVTNSIAKRVIEHKRSIKLNSFTAKYNLTKLVYYEAYSTIHDAIRREKQLKAGPRRKKINLIEKLNPDWKDLFEEDH